MTIPASRSAMTVLSYQQLTTCSLGPTHKKMKDGDVKIFNDVYTDHALVTKTLTMEMSNNGKGIWRANLHLWLKVQGSLLAN